MDDYLMPIDASLQPHELAALHRVIQAVMAYRNRNHRLLADQFRQLPDPEEYPKYYQLVAHPRALNTILTNLQNGYYTFPSQVFADLKLCFVNVGLAHNRSALRAQDAAKMEAVLEDLWDAEPDLPNVAQIGTSFDDGTGNIGLEDAGSPLEEVDDPMMTGGSNAPPASTVPRKKPRLTLPGGDVATEQSLAHLASFTDHLHTMLPSTDVNAAYAQLMGETPYSSLPGTPTAAEGSGSQQIVKLKRPVGRPRKSVPPDTPAKASTSKAPLAPQPTAAPPIVPVIYASAVPHVDSPAAEGSEAGDGQTETLSRKQKEEKEREEVAVPDTETGWLQDPVDKDRNALYLDIILRLLAECDHTTGRFLANAIATVPSREVRPEYYAKVQPPYLSLAIVQDKVKQGMYPHGEAFDRDLAKIFSDARRWISRDDRLRWGDTMAVQRLWQEITKVDSVLLNPHSASSLPKSAKKAGAATGVAMAPVTKATKSERIVLEYINFKGDTVRAGDWVHLPNTENPLKPVIGHVFKCWKRSDSPQRCMTVCWYYRPEETVHPITRNFYEHEIFKTSTLMDQNIEDFMEKCCALHHYYYIRGRPKYPLWHAEMPTYIIESRYKEDSKTTKKIKSWSTCLPVACRGRDRFEELDVFERIFHPPRVRSPFAIDLEGPVEAEGESAAQTRHQSPLVVNAATADSVPLVGPSASQSQPATPSGATHALPGRPQALARSSQTPVSTSGAARAQQSAAQAQQQVKQTGPQSLETIANNETFDPLPVDVLKHFRTDPATDELLWFTTPPIAAPPLEGPQHSLAYLAYLGKRQKEGEPVVVAKRARRAAPTLIETLQSVANTLNAME